MNYYSKEKPIILKEYGKIIQKMVEKAVEEPSREKRNDMAEAIIDFMAQLNPHVKSTEDYKQKLWDHLFFISDFKLEVDSPYPMVQRELIVPIPEKFDYPKSVNKHRHYGKYIVDFIDKAILLDEEKRKVITTHIASYMKLVHKTWNNEVVNDAIVKNDLSNFSKGLLEMSEEENIKHLLPSEKNNIFKNNFKNKNKKNKKNPNQQNPNQKRNHNPNQNPNQNNRNKIK